MVRGWSSVLIVFSVVLLWPLPSLGAGARHVRYEPGREMGLNLSVGRVTQVVFDSEIASIINPDTAALTIEKAGHVLYVKAVRRLGGRLFVRDRDGGEYTLGLLMVDAGEEDSTVYVLAGREGGAAGGSFPASEEDVYVDLVRSMEKGFEIPGFQRRRLEPPRLFYQEKGMIEMRITEVYTSPTVWGYVLEVENVATFPLKVNVPGWNIRGAIAGAVRKDYLSPREPKDSLEAFKGYPRKTEAFLLLDPLQAEPLKEEGKRHGKGFGLTR